MAEEASRFGYERVIAGIAGMIEDQGMAPDQKLPTLPELQDQFEVSSTTARRAVDELKRQGVVKSRQGSGLFVGDPTKAPAARTVSDEALRDAIDGLRQELRTLGDRLARVETQLEQLQPSQSEHPGRQPRRSTQRSQP
jgi:DNA-binding FadR family transcriptional regulator